MLATPLVISLCNGIRRHRISLSIRADPHSVAPAGLHHNSAIESGVTTSKYSRFLSIGHLEHLSDSAGGTLSCWTYPPTWSILLVEDLHDPDLLLSQYELLGHRPCVG